MKGREFRVRQGSVTAAEPDLVEPHAGTDEDGEAAWAYFGKERAGVSRRNAVEFHPAVCDRPGQQIEPTRRAFRIRDSRNGRGKVQMLHQGHDIDAPLLKHRARRQVHLMHAEFVDPVQHLAVASRQEGRPDAIGNGAQPQIEACRLDLSGTDLGRGADGAGRDHPAQGLRGKHAVCHANVRPER